MGSRTQHSVMFRAIQGGGWACVWMQGQHVPASASTSNRTRAVVERGPGVHPFISHHSTNVQLDTGKSRCPVAEVFFSDGRFEACTDQKAYCFEEILTCALAKRG